MKVLKEKPIDGILRKKSETTLINLLLYPESVDLGILDECSIRIMDLARSHLMVPSLFSRLSNSPDASLKSTDFYRNLLEETLHESKRALSMTHQLNVLFGEIETAKIPCCLMKGLAAASMLHGGVQYRHVGDADLLTNLRDLPRLRMILVELNWQRVPFRASFDSTSELYTKNSENFMLDIHTHPVEDRFASKIRTEEVLDLSERNALVPMPYKLPFPSREDMLLLLCVHGMKHLWCRLIWVFDIVCALERKDDFNWDLVLSKSSKLACLRQVLCGIRIAELLSGKVAPGCVSEAISKDSRVQKIAMELVSLIFERRAGVAASFHNILFHMKLQDSYLWAIKVPIYRALSRMFRCLMTCQ